MSERKSAEVEKVIQIIDEDLKIDINQRPSEVGQWEANNQILRAFVYLTAFNLYKKPIYLEATNSRALKVANIGSGIEQIRIATGTATNTESGALTTPIVSNKVILFGLDYDYYFRPSPDGITYQDQIYVAAGQEKALDLVVTKYKVQRAEDNDAEYYIEFYR